MNYHPVIQISNVTQTHMTPQEEIKALDSISLTIDSGETLVLVGPSGCGKSTLLSLLAGLATPTYGKITIDTEQTRRPSRTTGYMLQKDGLLPWRTVEENIFLGLEITGQNNPSTREYAHQLLDEVGLSHTSHQFPDQLSGGMRQRVALVRTLVLRPKILLLDEPFSALDYQNKLQLEKLLSDILEKYKMTAVLVTHDLGEAIAIGDRIVMMKNHPGTISQIVEIPREIRNLNPIAARNHPLFYSLIELWQEAKIL